jgi:LacI family transcriptional regulator
MQIAMQTLLGHGRRRIGLLTSPGNTYGRRARQAGYIAVLEAHGIRPDPALIAYSMPYRVEGVAAARCLLRQHSAIDALVCHNDLLAVGALQACAELAICVPNDVAVIGFDDIPLAALITPALTTLRVPSAELGRCAVQMLFDHLSDGVEQAEVIFTPELVVRQSAP